MFNRYSKLVHQNLELSRYEVASNLRQEAQKRTVEQSEIMLSLEHGSSRDAVEEGDAINDDRKRVSIGLKKTTTENSLKLLKQRLVDTKDKLVQEFADLSSKMLEFYQAGESGLVGGPLQARTDVENAINLAVKKIDGLLSHDCVEIEKATTAAADHYQLRSASAQLVELQSLIRADDSIRSAKDLVTKTKRMITMETKKKDAAERKSKFSEGKAVVATMPPSPLSAIIKAVNSKLSDEAQRNVSDTVFEAKMGNRPARMKSKLRKDGNIILQEIKRNQYVKALVKQVHAHMRSSTVAHMQNGLRDVGKTKRVNKLVHEALDTYATSRLLLPDEDWTNRIYGFEIYATSESFSSIFTTSNCVIEARLPISGGEIVLGVPYASVPGEMFRDKRNFLAQLDCDKLADLVVQQHGFCIEFSEDDDYVTFIPSGFILLTASLGGSVCLRWGVSSDERDTARVHAMAEAVSGSFAEYRNASQPLGQFLNYLRDQS